MAGAVGAALAKRSMEPLRSAPDSSSNSMVRYVTGEATARATKPENTLPAASMAVARQSGHVQSSPITAVNAVATVLIPQMASTVTFWCLLNVLVAAAAH